MPIPAVHLDMRFVLSPIAEEATSSATEGPTPKEEDASAPPSQPASATSTQSPTPTTRDEMRDFVADGMNFLGTLAKMLSEPGGAKTIADALVKEGPATGQATLNIPVPDKATVTTLLSALSSLLNR